MPKGYKHLAYEQRCQIHALLKRNTSKSRIAVIVGVHPTTITREIKRNSGRRGYRYKQAQSKTIERRLKANMRLRKLTLEVTLYVEEKLCKFQWSPEQIAGRLKLKYGIKISHELIYRYIWNDKKDGGLLYKHLRRKGKKYNNRSAKKAGRGLIPGRIGIEERPQIVDEKLRVGDFEADTIVGANHVGAIVSLVDRKSKLTRLKLIRKAKSTETATAIIELLGPIKRHVHTITSDNGKEFAKHKVIKQKLVAQFFFANPYRSCERGLNENTNGLVRQYFPKGTCFSKLSHEQLERVEKLLNSRPRKSLRYQTPNEVFLRETGEYRNVALRC